MRTNRRLKKPDTSSKLILEEIIGLTTKNVNGLASNICTSVCAYIAGCVVVVYNVDSCTQSHLMVSHRTPKPLSCVAMSRDGRFVAAGELGSQPSVLVWDCSTRTFVSELEGHLYGVECITFSPNGEHLVSVGGYIYLWDWRNGVLVTKLKASSSCSAVTSVSFSSDAKYIVTAGKKHLKFWTVGSSPRTRLNKGTGSLAMNGKPINLGPQKGSSFMSITSAIRTNSEKVGNLLPIYALTDGGVLCLIDSGLAVRKSVDLKVRKGFALSVSSKLIACACSNGVVQLFTIESLNYAGSLLYSKAKSSHGKPDVDCHNKDTEKDVQLMPTLADAVACQFSTSEKLVVIYGDHALYIWDIHDINKATRCCVLVSHSACIWDVKNLCCENMHDPSLACVARGCFGGVAFATCSADGTIRLWDLALQPNLAEDDADDHCLNADSGRTSRLVNAGIFERDTMEVGIGTQGFRSMAASSDGKYLAAGDCEGNLHIYNLNTSDYTCFQDAHDAEILSMNFSLSSKNFVTSEEVANGNYLLVSGGRDRIIHLYDVNRNFDLIESIDDHSAAVTSVKLTCHGNKILSCSADRSLVFRDVIVTDNGHKILRRHHQLASHGTVYDMSVDPTMQFVVTVGQDKKINTFDIASGKLTRSFKQDKDFGDPIKVAMDPSGSYLVCSYSNKSMCIYDCISGEMVTQAMGHGEVITGVIFLPDCKHVVSVGGDGCIFVWILPARMSSKILQKMKENSVPLSPENLGPPLEFHQIVFSEEEGQQCRVNPDDEFRLENSNQFGQKCLFQGGASQRTPTFRFSISRLPKWAQVKVQQVEHTNFSPVVGGAGKCGLSGLEVEASPILGVEGSESCLSSLSTISPDVRSNQITPISQENLGCFAVDRRWLNVYTVCMDALNSPELQHLMNLNMPASSSNLSQIQTGIPNGGKSSIWEAKLVSDYENRFTSERHACSSKYSFPDKNNDRLGMPNKTTSQNVVSGHVADELHLQNSGSQMRGVEVDAYHIKSEDSDLFKQHFGILSKLHKVERSKSSMKRRYSAQYVVRWDYPGGRRGLFDTPVWDFGGRTLDYRDKGDLHFLSENPATQNPEEQGKVNPCQKGTQISLQSFPTSIHTLPQCELTRSPIPENIKLNRIMDKNRTPAESKLQQEITACREALLNLDAAAEKVLHSFSELETSSSREENSDGPGAKLYDEAGWLLSSIAEKLNAVKKLLQER